MSDSLIDQKGRELVSTFLREHGFIVEERDAANSSGRYIRARINPVRLFVSQHGTSAQGGVLPGGWPDGVHPVLILVRTAQAPEELAGPSDTEKHGLFYASTIEEPIAGRPKRLAYLAKVLLAEDGSLKEGPVFEPVME